ncbi:CHAT domain-containing protein [candidate division KSB1 bacterium]|nr:CHAT domain-containing protein [candidate division KSB1 bacterium]
MSETNAKPLIVVAFSNDQDAYLNMIIRERKSIFKALQQHHDRGYIQVHKEENTSIEDIFDLCNRYSDRIAIFHYGGHASGTHLQLEATGGAAEMANAAGLAQLLGQQKALQLVFLNGCATQDQVEKLFAGGVKAVIATSVPINDEMATKFAEQFYQARANKASIHKAFQTAQAFVATRYGKEKEVGEFRGMNWAGKEETQPTGMPWGLYVNENGNEALAWTLPEAAEHQVIIRGAAVSAKAGAPVNTELIETLFNAVAKHSPEVGVLWEAAKQSKRQDLRMVRQQIIDSFPAPVGEQLRKLFAGNTIDVQRLRQLVLTYETVAELFCFAVLSQLWDARHGNPALTFSDAHLAELNSFFALNAESQPTFDYVKLIAAVGNILHENKVAPFVEEFSDLNAVLQFEEFDHAYRFMEEMRAELLRGKVAAEEIESFCWQAEKHLGAIMSALAFLVKYKLTAIKRIDIIKPRHKNPAYRHSQVVLDRVTAGIMDSEEVYPAFTDSESVILLKTVEDVKEYLSLSPFIIDENAFTGDQNSKLFFYSHHNAADDSFHFRFVDNAEDELIVSEERYPQIKKQFEEFRQAMSNK